MLLPLFGRHNVCNAAAAAAAAIAMGLGLDHVARGLAGIAPVKGRLAPLEGVAGIRILDDSYNANPESMAAAIQTLADTPVENGARRIIQRRQNDEDNDSVDSV